MSVIKTTTERSTINTLLENALRDVRAMFVPHPMDTAATNIEFNKGIKKLPPVWTMERLPGVPSSRETQIEITRQLSAILHLATEFQYTGGLAVQLATNDIPFILLGLVTVCKTIGPSKA